MPSRWSIWPAWPTDWASNATRSLPGHRYAERDQGGFRSAVLAGNAGIRDVVEAGADPPVIAEAVGQFRAIAELEMRAEVIAAAAIAADGGIQRQDDMRRQIDVGDEAAIAVIIAVASHQQADMRADLPDQVGAEAVVDVDFTGTEIVAQGFPGAGADDEQRILIRLCSRAEHGASCQGGGDRQPEKILFGHKTEIPIRERLAPMIGGESASGYDHLDIGGQGGQQCQKIVTKQRYAAFGRAVTGPRHMQEDGA